MDCTAPLTNALHTELLAFHFATLPPPPTVWSVGSIVLDTCTTDASCEEDLVRWQ